MSKTEEANGDKARRYRDRAKECRRRAAETKDPDARPGFLQVAKSYERMADIIERKSGGTPHRLQIETLKRLSLRRHQGN